MENPKEETQQTEVNYGKIVEDIMQEHQVDELEALEILMGIDTEDTVTIDMMDSYSAQQRDEEEQREWEDYLFSEEGNFPHW